MKWQQIVIGVQKQHLIILNLNSTEIVSIMRMPEINSYVHYSSNYDNAFWDGVRMTYGDGNSFKPLTSIDCLWP